MRPLKSLFLIFFIVLILPGCAGHLSTKDLQLVREVKVAHFPTPGLSVQTIAAAVIRGIGGGAILPVIVSRHLDEKATAEGLKDLIPIPDIGELIVDRLSEKAPKEIPGWPTTSAVPGAVGNDYHFADSSVILIRVDQFALTERFGMAILIEATMRDRNGSKVFNKFLGYSTKENLHLVRTVENYSESKWQLLIDEIPIAADHLAMGLVSDIRKSLE